MARRQAARARRKSIVRTRPDLEHCQTPLNKSLWALRVAKDKSRGTHFSSAVDISETLLSADVSLSPLRILKALARAGDAVARRQENGKPVFRLMAAGERTLASTVAGGDLHALYVTGEAPWSDRRLVVKDGLKSLKGKIHIVDKFFGVESLDFLQGFEKTAEIQFLTARLVGNVDGLRREILRFKKEFPRAQFRLYGHASELHDRYILSDDEVWLVGHGIKDLGAKESFVVILKHNFGKDLRAALVKTFQQRWNTAHDI